MREFFIVAAAENVELWVTAMIMELWVRMCVTCGKQFFCFP